MAIVLNNNQMEDEQQKKDSTGPITTGVTGESSTISQQASNPNQGQPGSAQPGQGPITPGQQKAGSSGRFQNLGKFIKANQPGQFGQQFQQKVGQVAQQGKQAIGSAQQQFNTEAGRAGQQLGQLGTQVSQAGGVLKANPQDDNSFNQAAEQLGQGLNAQYQGPQNLANQERLQFQAQQAGGIAQAAGTGAGRTALLQRFFAKPTYSAGQSRLDSMLLGSQGDALRQVRQEGRQVGSQLDAARQLAAARAGELGQQATSIQSSARKLGEEAVGGIEGGLKSEAQKFAEESLGMYDVNNMAKALEGQDIQLAGMNLSPAQKAALAQQGLASVQGASLSQEQLKAMREKGDYSSLLGKTSAAAQVGAGRFNKLAGMLGKDSQIAAQELLNKGSVGLADEQRANLEGQIGSQATSLAERGYSNEALGALNRQYVNDAFTRAGGTAEQFANKLLEDKIVREKNVQVGGKTRSAATLTPEQKAQYIREETARQIAAGGAKGWAGDEARRIGDAQLAAVRDRSSAAGRTYYEQQLASAKQEALRNLLKGVQ